MTYSRGTSLSIFFLAIALLVGGVLLGIPLLVPVAFVVMGAAVLWFLAAEEGYSRGDLLTVAAVYALAAGGLGAMVALMG